MKRHLQVFLLAIAFDIYWTLVVLFRERGVLLWLGLAVLACLLLKPVRRIYAILLALAGSTLDATWAVTGLLRFSGESILPLWMMALWLMFACVWNHLTEKTNLPSWLLVFMAAAGGPMAYYIGEHLGAITFLAPTFIVMSSMTLGWLVLMLFFHIFTGRRQ
jgi:hypothetical protein